MTIARTPRDMALAAVANLQFSLNVHKGALERVMAEYSKAPLGSLEERRLALLLDHTMGATEATVQAIGLLRSEFSSLLEETK